MAYIENDGMIAQFEGLLPSEAELMYKAPILVCILIAGADGHIDRKEIQGAIELTRKKQTKAKASLIEFYRAVGEDFEDKLKVVIQSLPIESTQRNPLVIEDLSKLNAIFQKLNKTFVIEFYNSLREIAQKIAESSGGLLGMKSVGQEEARLIGLPMIKAPSH